MIKTKSEGHVCALKRVTSSSVYTYEGLGHWRMKHRDRETEREERGSEREREREREKERERE